MHVEDMCHLGQMSLLCLVLRSRGRDLLLDVLNGALRRFAVKGTPCCRDSGAGSCSRGIV